MTAEEASTLYNKPEALTSKAQVAIVIVAVLVAAYLVIKGPGLLKKTAEVPGALLGGLGTGGQQFLAGGGIGLGMGAAGFGQGMGVGAAGFGTGLGYGVGGFVTGSTSFLNPLSQQISQSIGNLNPFQGVNLKLPWK